MTRINSAINIKSLTDEHLLAEHREIKRMPAYFLKAIHSGSINKIPKLFCLGTGHVTFFLNKQLFLYKRYINIYTECRSRGFDVENYEPNWLSLKSEFEKFGCWNDYTVTDEERRALQHRIAERINESPKQYFHYRKEKINKDKSIYLLNSK